MRTRKRMLEVARGNRLVIVCAAIFAFTILVAIFVPLLPLPDPNKQELGQTLRPPFWESRGSTGHLLGTDYLGRDILSRLAWGTRESLIVGVGAVLLAALVGIAFGVIAPYVGGWVDEVIMRGFDVVLAMPTLLIAIIALTLLGASLPVVILVLGLRMTVYYGRTLRSRVLTVKDELYVKAARVAGLSRRQIMWRHVLPNSVAPAIVLSAIYLGLVILLASSLNFLGLTSGTVSWGFMVAEGLNYLSTAWWAVTLPGLCIMILVFSANVIGDYLRDVFDPRAS